ncbi:MAG: [NiFe]-hydrogenase assembly chaperone HybE [Pseudomonadota bacterium]
MSGAFESSVSGALRRDDVLECGVCWWTYDPAIGDETRDVAPGAAFTELPVDWRCPSCDAGKDKFMVKVMGDGDVAAAPEATMDARVAALTSAYEASAKAIIGLPVYNDALEVAAVGFREHGDAFVGVVTTPWCMNLVALPRDAGAQAPGPLGSKRQHVLPSGGYTFTLGRMEGVGFVETCSLFSPMEDFQDHAAALTAAAACAEGAFEQETPPPPPKVERRFVLTRNGATA